MLDISMKPPDYPLAAGDESAAGSISPKAFKTAKITPWMTASRSSSLGIDVISDGAGGGQWAASRVRNRARAYPRDLAPGHADVAASALLQRAARAARALDRRATARLVGSG
jgi:hypothetical protein